MSDCGYFSEVQSGWLYLVPRVWWLGCCISGQLFGKLMTRSGTRQDNIPNTKKKVANKNAEAQQKKEKRTHSSDTQTGETSPSTVGYPTVKGRLLQHTWGFSLEFMMDKMTDKEMWASGQWNGVNSHIMGLTLGAADISATPSIYSSEKAG